MEFETLSEELALQIIDTCDEQEDSDRVLQAYQYLLDTEIYLSLPASFARKIENLVEQGLIG